jgi:hypothetical protein
MVQFNRSRYVLTKVWSWKMAQRVGFVLISVHIQVFTIASKQNSKSIIHLTSLQRQYSLPRG